MAIQTFYSSRTEALTGILLSQLRDGQQRRQSPFVQTPIIVPNSGMQRYLELKIAEHFGICSQIDISFASRFLAQQYRRVLGNDYHPGNINVAALTLRLLAFWQKNPPTVDAEPVLYSLLDQYQTARLRYVFANHVAQYFERYINDRPALVTAWQQQQTIYHSPQESWQMRLFNALGLGQFSQQASQRAFHQALAITQSVPDVPVVHLLGFHAMPPAQLADFMALSEVMTVNYYVFNPSVAYWRDIVPETLKAQLEMTAEAESTLMSVGHPLLASWGQSGKYFIETLNEQTNDAFNIDHHLEQANTSVLTWLQQTIRQLHDIDNNDDVAVLQDIVEQETSEKSHSLTVHVAASPRREVEILYDYLCQLFDTPEKERICPSDILVMVPHLADYAPHIQAIFGAQSEASIPFSLSNQVAAQADIETQALLALLRLVEDDFSAQTLCDVISAPSIRQQLKLTSMDIDSIRYWLVKSHTAGAWEDSGHDHGSSLEKLLDSLLLAEFGGQGCHIRMQTGQIRGALDAYAHGQQSSLHQFCQLLLALKPLFYLRKQELTLDEWWQHLRPLIEYFLGEQSSVIVRLRTFYDDLSQVSWATEMQNSVFDYDAMMLAIKNYLQTDELHGPFLSGGVSFCAMVPMRSIPAKMICLLGLNHDFPTHSHKDPLDLRYLKPQWSDRQSHNEYKYFFLETLMATREQLYLSYVGCNEQTGESIAPSILVEQLLGYLGRYVPAYVESICHVYPLQGFLTSDRPCDTTYQGLYQRAPASTKHNDADISTDDFPEMIDYRLSSRGLAEAIVLPLETYLRHLGAGTLALPTDTLAEHNVVSVDSGLDAWWYKRSVFLEKQGQQDAKTTLMVANHYAPRVISERLLAKADMTVTPLTEALAEFGQIAPIPLSRLIRQTLTTNETTYHIDCYLYSEEYCNKGLLRYSLSALTVDKLLHLWVMHVLINSQDDLPAYESYLYTIEKNHVAKVHLKPLADHKTARCCLIDLLQLWQYLTQHPYALTLRFAPKKSPQRLDYQSTDYTLYPRLSDIAKTCVDETLTLLLQRVDTALSAAMV